MFTTKPHPQNKINQNIRFKGMPCVWGPTILYIPIVSRSLYSGEYFWYNILGNCALTLNGKIDEFAAKSIKSS